MIGEKIKIEIRWSRLNSVTMTSCQLHIHSCAHCRDSIFSKLVETTYQKFLCNHPTIRTKMASWHILIPQYSIPTKMAFAQQNLNLKRCTLVETHRYLKKRKKKCVCVVCVCVNLYQFSASLSLSFAISLLLSLFRQCVSNRLTNFGQYAYCLKLWGISCLAHR